MAALRANLATKQTFTSTILALFHGGLPIKAKGFRTFTSSKHPAFIADRPEWTTKRTRKKNNNEARKENWANNIINPGRDLRLNKLDHQLLIG
jgi:hypothetical protein